MFWREIWRRFYILGLREGRLVGSVEVCFSREGLAWRLGSRIIWLEFREMKLGFSV